MTATPPPDIWTFALALYRQPGFADACLTLQDEHGADVVMLIGLCWLARRDGGAPDVSAIATLDAALAGWRDAVIVPLRTLRRALKPRLAGLPPAAGEARERIKEAELASERRRGGARRNAADRRTNRDRALPERPVPCESGGYQGMRAVPGDSDSRSAEGAVPVIRVLARTGRKFGLYLFNNWA